MDINDARGLYFDAFTELEKALLTVVIGFAAIPIILTFFINQPWMRAAASALGLIITVPTWLFFVYTARRIYDHDGYLRIDTALTVAGGAIPVALVLFYFIGIYITGPLPAITGAVVFTTLAVVYTYYRVGDRIHTNSFYAIENGWLMAYRDGDVQDAAHDARPELTTDGGRLSFQPMLILLVVAVGLIFNTVFTSTTAHQQLIASILIGTGILVPVTIMVALTLVETTILGDPIGEFAARLGTAYLYAFVGILMLTSVLVDGTGWAVVPPAVAIFCPFIAFTTIIIHLYDPNLLTEPAEYAESMADSTDENTTSSSEPLSLADLQDTSETDSTEDTEDIHDDAVIPDSESMDADADADTTETTMSTHEADADAGMIPPSDGEEETGDDRDSSTSTDE